MKPLVNYNERIQVFLFFETFTVYIYLTFYLMKVLFRKTVDDSLREHYRQIERLVKQGTKVLNFDQLVLYLDFWNSIFDFIVLGLWQQLSQSGVWCSMNNFYFFFWHSRLYIFVFIDFVFFRASAKLRSAKIHVAGILYIYRIIIINLLFVNYSRFNNDND